MGICRPADSLVGSVVESCWVAGPYEWNRPGGDPPIQVAPAMALVLDTGRVVWTMIDSAEAAHDPFGKIVRVCRLGADRWPSSTIAIEFENKGLILYSEFQKAPDRNQIPHFFETDTLAQRWGGGWKRLEGNGAYV